MTQLNDPMTSFYAYCDSKEEALFAKLMAQFAKEQGEKYIQENERLKADPKAAVPEEATRRMQETIKKTFEEKQSG